MQYPEWLQQIFYKTSDFITAIIPRKTPTLEKFKQAKIMAHRGVFDNGQIKENTCAAFAAAVDAGVWGIELDVRWTRDLQLVVHHDADTLRVFGKNIAIKDVTLAELQHAIPEIPTLQQVAQQFGKKVKLVIEFKETCPRLQECKHTLQQALAQLTPDEDFYFISLTPRFLEEMNSYSSDCYFPVGRVAMRPIIQLALSKHYGGVFGHYVFTCNKFIKQMLAANKQVGTGFIESKNCMFRELNRGVTILSSNHAATLQAIINKHLGE